MTRISGLEGAGIGLMQALIGVGSVVGVVLGGGAADRPGAGHALALSFPVSVLALASYSLLMALDLPPAPAIGLLAAGMVAGAAALFTRTPILQARIVAAAPEARTTVLALNGSMVFVGQGLGTAIGGAAISIAGLGAVGLADAFVALLGVGITMHGLGRGDPRPVPAA